MHERSIDDAGIDGYCDPHFLSVREAFARNFDEHDELGAAVCVRLGGRTVVDLWGGYRDKQRTVPWERDTLVNIYSVGKGIISLLLLTLVERGAVALDAPVSRYWPEFGAGGKDLVSVRTLLAHRAGLPSVRERLPEGSMLDWDRMCAELAAQVPFWPPGELHGYHVNTFGYLVGEIARRVTGLSVADALREHVTGPLDADLFFGLPSEHDDRAAEVVVPEVALTEPHQWAQVFPPTGDADRDTMIWHAYFNPSGLSGVGIVNTRPWRSAVIPSTNGQATARAVAAVYDALLAGGPAAATWPGRGLLADAIERHSDGTDEVLGRPSSFGLGFQLAASPGQFGPGERSFGHYGYGGTAGFADPDTGLAFAYLMNRPGDRWQIPRTQNLVAATYESLAV